MSNYIGQSIGRYHILEQIGQGGMATVYKAYDTRLERDVAIKVIRKEAFPPEQLERVLKRFEREAKALAKMSHANIVKVHDYGEHDGAPYLVMENLSGGTLKARLGQPTPYTEAAWLLAPVARALAYAHLQGILHRDVKPANILITQSGEPVLTDFGIAKLLEQEDGATLTGTGVGVGTPEYMAPEQGLGKEIDGRADVYALGIVFYELVTGRKPFAADTPLAVLYKQMNDPLPRPRDFASSLPEAVEKVLFKALSKRPEDRYADMDSFARALEKLAMQAIQMPLSRKKRNTAQTTTPHIQPIDTETTDKLDTSTIQVMPTHTKKSFFVKRKRFIIGAVALTLIGAAIILGKMNIDKNQTEQPGPIVITKIVTKEPVVVVQSPTQVKPATIIPLQTKEELESPEAQVTPTPAFLIEEIPVYDDFEDGYAGNWYIASWSDLTDYQIEEKDGFLSIQTIGEKSKYSALFYCLEEPRVIEKFFVLVNLKEINSQGIFNLYFVDNASHWYNLGVSKYDIFISGENLYNRNILKTPYGGLIWFGVEVHEEKVKFFVKDRFVFETDITGGFKRDIIGFELGATDNKGSVTVEIEEVRIEFKE